MTSSLLILAGIALSLAVTIGVAILLNLLTTEARESVPVLCHRLLDRTAARLPAELQDRREEWESELADAAGRPITQMVIAVRIWRDGRALAQEATAGVAEAETNDGRREVGQVAGFARLLVLLERPLDLVRRRLPDDPARLWLFFRVGFITVLGSIVFLFGALSKDKIPAVMAGLSLDIIIVLIILIILSLREKSRLR